MSAEESGEGTPATRGVATSRLIIGVAQGAALFWLYNASDTHVWPATDGSVFAPLLLVALFVPLGISLGVGSLRTATLTSWTLFATFALAGVAYFAIWKSVPDWKEVDTDKFVAVPQIVPPFDVFFFVAIWLFIAHVLVASGDVNRRLIADYRTQFDVAWKLAVQLALGAAFVGVLWALLYLGADLFELIGLNFLKKLIEHAWFAIPATALAVSVAVHLTDVRASLVRGVRTLALVLLGWFLPLLVLLIGSFFAALILTGVEPLWGTRHASVSLLSAAGALVILVNAVYQDGDSAHAPHRVLRYAARAACALLVPLVVLSADALYLRVAQYGWTAERVATEACIVIAACYALGYALAALYPGVWLKQIERWNFVSALLILLIIGTIYSPLADPDRIAVASQVSRLESGKVGPGKFDFDYLRWRSGRYGVDALRHLAGSASAKYARDIRLKSRELLAKLTSYQSPAKAKGADIEANIAVYPKGMKLPADFLHQNWEKISNLVSVPACLTRHDSSCSAFLLQLSNDGGSNIVILNDSQADVIFAKDSRGVWRATGRPGPLWTCGTVVDALRAGQVTIAPAVAPAWRDITVKGAHLTVLPTFDQESGCPK